MSEQHGEKDARYFRHEHYPVSVEAFVADVEESAEEAATHLATYLEGKDEGACHEGGHGRLHVCRNDLG